MKHETLLSRVLAIPSGRGVSESCVANRNRTGFFGTLGQRIEFVDGPDHSRNIGIGEIHQRCSGEGGTVSGPITGYVAGDVIAFSVLWPGATASITSWVGQLVTENGEQTLDTLWHLILDVPDAQDPSSIWTTIYAGADSFKRQ